MKSIKGTIWLIRTIMLIAAVFKLVIGDFGLAAYGVLAVCLTFVPELMYRFLSIELSNGLRIVYTVFVFCSMTVAKLFHFYDLTSWWDKLLHFSSGILLAYVGVMIARAITHGDNKIIILLFGLAFGVGCAAIWEIWEFSGDALFALDSQRRATGVVDTMGDIIAGTIGSCITIPFLKKEKDV